MNESNQDQECLNKLVFSNEEIQKLRDGGFIPQEFFDQTKQHELENFLQFNKENLLEQLNPNYDKFPFAAIVPPSNEWQNAPDLKIIDRRNGEVVQTLEMGTDFMLCEGIYLKIKAKEIKEWEQDTAQVKSLNKEQHETLKSVFEKIGPNKPLTRKEIVSLIEEVRKPLRKTKKYRQSGHLVDQKLKYNTPEKQPTLFDMLLPETKQKIEESKYEIKAEGIRLTYAENKLIHALNLLLCEKSQHTNPKDEAYYSGNAPSEIVPYGHPDQSAPAPVIKFKPAELYKAFTCSETYSGADARFVIETLHQLESKKVLIKYDRVKKIKKGKKTETLTDRIEDFQSLIKIVSFIPDMSDEEKSALDCGDNSVRENKGEIIIALNPIFRDQIDTKYIEFPEDSQRRLVIAAGGHKKVTASMQRLMEYMLREISGNRYQAQINEENLPYILGLELYIKQNRKKLLKERVEKDVQSIINIGIILKVEKQPNSTGGTKWMFYLNKDYE